MQDFVDLPVDFAGKLNATATIAGSVANPQLSGELALVEASLNGTSVETAAGQFSYSNARLNFGTTVVVSGPEPIEIRGSIPYQLPLTSMRPNNQISLDLSVRNEGLALLNLFTRQVEWVDGKGRVNLQVRGTLNQPLVNGFITVTDSTLQAQALPEPLTNVTGTIRFNRDRIRVEQLSGQYSEGQVAAAGVLPTFAGLSGTDPDQKSPLAIRLNKLALKLKGLYTGGVNGDLIVTGALVGPKLGGQIQLTQGQVLLGDPASPLAAGSTSPLPLDATSPNATVEVPADVASLQFNNLRVTLGNDIQVTRLPLLNFLASGDLTLNGSVNNMRPQGIVRFQRGQVNLFTTQFRLNPQEPNYAEFDPNQGLDPNLNVNLVTAVTEVTGSRTGSFDELDDVPASSLGGLESIRIAANVTGPASQLVENFKNNVELTSSPARDQDEIIALIGGGSVEGLGEGESTLALANLASSAFFSTVQGSLDNVLGNRVDLRLFPTLTPN
ncbi:MAG TPA: translocation/assembly module TamB domain-containing protein, partial [Candidatus Caenarcaniphilales bacterium]